MDLTHTCTSAAMYFTYLGWITNSEVLNRETADRYDLRVVAYDLGDVSRSSTADVEVRTSSVILCLLKFMSNNWEFHNGG